jgi:hypothetical protein
MPVGIQYIGPAEDHLDRLYGTNLRFKAGEIYSVDDAVAKRMLVHSDIYAEAQIPKGAMLAPAIPEAIDERRNEPPLLDFTRMDDRELREFARLHYGEELPGNARHQTLVDRVVAFSNRAR